MFVASLIGILALAAAVAIVVVAVRKHQSETGIDTNWSDVKDAFTADSIRGVRQEIALLSAPDRFETDMRVGDLFEEAEEGSGYLEPRDIRTLRSGRS